MCIRDSGVGAKRVAHLGAVECDAHGAVGTRVADVAVVSDVGEVEAFDLAPLAGVEGLGGGVLHGGNRTHASALYLFITSPTYKEV